MTFFHSCVFPTFCGAEDGEMAIDDAGVTCPECITRQALPLDTIHAGSGLIGHRIHNTPSGFMGQCGARDGNVTFDDSLVDCLKCISLMWRPRIAAKFFLDVEGNFKSQDLMDEYWGTGARAN